MFPPIGVPNNSQTEKYRPKIESSTQSFVVDISSVPTHYEFRRINHEEILQTIVSTS